MSLGENIKRCRQEKNISQRELGRRINKTGQLISSIERGETTPSMDTINKIATVLEVDISNLISSSNLDLKDTDTKVALMIRIEEIINHLRDDFFKDYAVEELETLLNEIKNDNIVPF